MVRSVQVAGNVSSEVLKKAKKTAKLSVSSTSPVTAKVSKESLLDKRAKERRSAKLKATLVSGKKSLEKPKHKKPSSSQHLGQIGNPVTGATGVAKPPPRKRRGLHQLKQCILMQQSVKSMVRETPFRRHLSKRMLGMELVELKGLPYLGGPAYGFHKSAGAIAGLTALLSKKATDLLRRAASYTEACGRRTVTNKDVLRAAMQDEDLLAVVEDNEDLMSVLDQPGVDGERTRQLQRSNAFVGVKAHIYHQSAAKE